MMTRMAQVQWYSDTVFGELCKESENGRLLRLLLKLGHVADRAELGNDTQWGAHSDRHLLRLYRDSLLNQQNEHGGAVLDFAQVVHSLNRLDVGHDGKALLSSPGMHGQSSLLLVSYRDIKEILERSFEELVASQSHEQHGQHGQHGQQVEHMGGMRG